MREIINLLQSLTEAKVADANVSQLKKSITDLLKTTTEGTVLHQVLKVLESGNIDERIASVVGTDKDAKGFIKQITDAIIQSDASIQQKNDFLEKFPKGILNVKTLLDGKPHSFDEIVGPGFPADLLADLSVRLTSHGVGPGEVALAIMSPKVKWSGREAGGGDILVNGRPIEVKTRVSSGGRWINPRKAGMNLPAIKQAIEEASGLEVPDRLNVNQWVSTYRPEIDPKVLPKVCKIIADGIFTSTDTKAYQKALAKGDARQITDEHLRTGYNNYKALSGFEGILMMDIPTRAVQYFGDYDDMVGSIKNDAVYIYAPEGEMMPKASLVGGLVGGGGEEGAAPKRGSKVTKATEPTVGTNDFNKAASQLAGGPKTRAPKQSAEPTKGVGRSKRK